MKSLFLKVLIVLTLLVNSCGGGSSSSTTTEDTVEPVYTVALDFQRGDGGGGLDPFTVTATIGNSGAPVTGATPAITLGRGSHGGITDHGDGRYSFTVTPDQTGEYPVTVSYETASHSETALVLKSVADGWGQPMAVSGLVNTEGYEDGISITADGEYLFVQYGPIYFSAMFYFPSPLGCDGHRLEPERCTHEWLDTTIGPYTAPERPDFFDGRFDGTTFLHNSNLWGFGIDEVPFFAPATMFYGFKRQTDGSYAEPFYVAFDDENDAIANPFGISLRRNGDGTASIVFALDDPNNLDMLMVDHDDNGTFDRESRFDVYTTDITLGQHNLLGTYVAGSPPPRVEPFPSTLVDFGKTGPDGIYGTQGNPHIYYSADGTIRSIWTDDEYDGTDSDPDNDSDAGDVSAYVLTDGTFPSGSWTKVVLPATVNGGGEQRMPFFNGQGLYFSQDVDIYYSAYTGADTVADYADDSNWATPTMILEKDSGTDLLAPLGKVHAVGEPNIATIDDVEHLFFVYVIARGVDAGSGLADLNIQAGYVRKSMVAAK